ncbi:MAG TPA: sugar phosphate nucleotidyltransferase, partial [bacterium]|nr:sugar phosphate nucleotidyltransferase [bacterium]
MSLEMLSFVLAGGKGTRLGPLCDERAKPAVIFGGKYRIIDFVLNNLVNSGIYRIKVLTQFKSDSLNKHLSNGWQLNRFLGQYIDAVPAQMRTGEDWYRGTADAIYQNLNLIYENDPEFVSVFGGDHIYKMDVRQMLDFHRQKGAVATVAAIPVPKKEASEFGIIQTDANDRIIAFVEKPKNPPEIPGRPGWCYASMGNYLFTTCPLIDTLKNDAADAASSHDFGKDVIPYLQRNFPVYAYNFATNRVPGANPEEHGYWRDVGTVDAYFEANMDLRNVK